MSNYSLLSSLRTSVNSYSSFKKVKISIQEEEEQKLEIGLDDIYSCPECDNVPLIKFYRNKIYIICPNHKVEMTQDNMEEIIPKILRKKEVQKCKSCNNKKEAFYYCYDDKTYMCEKCKKDFHDKKNHKTADLKQLVSTCKDHGEEYTYYCINHKQNCCGSCNGHENCDIKKYNEIINNKSIVNALTRSIEQTTKYIISQEAKFIEDLKRIVEEEYTKYKKKINYKYLLFSSIAYTYLQNPNNYEIAMNVKELMEKNNIMNLRDSDKFTVDIKQVFKKDVEEISKINDKLNLSQSLEESKKAVKAILYTSTDKLLTAGEEKVIKVYNFNGDSFNFSNNLIGHKNSINSLDELKDIQNSILSGSEDKSIKLWDLSTGLCTKTFNGHEGTVFKVIGLDKNNFVSCSSDSSIRLWDKNNEITFKRFNGHNDWVNCIIKVKKRTLVSSSLDKTLRIWDIDRQKEYDNLRFNGITAYSNNSMFYLENLEELIVGEQSQILKINIQKHTITKVMDLQGIFGLLTVCPLSTGEKIVSDQIQKGRNEIVILEKEKNMPRTIDFPNGGLATSIIEINEYLIGFGCDNGKVLIYNYLDYDL